MHDDLKKDCMICRQLEKHWRMCQALRSRDMPQLRPHGKSYFWAKCKLPLDPIEAKAIRFVTEISNPKESPYYLPAE